MSEDRAVEPVQSVDRALTILEVLARAGVAGVTEVAAELDVHKSTAFRLMSTLECHDLVEQTGDRGKYRLGVGILRLAGATTARLDVVQEARQICRRLAAATGETVNLAVLSGHSALYLDQVAGSSALQSHNWVGQHIPLHATSNGKVLLSELDGTRLKEVLGSLPSYTDRTITKKAPLMQELAEVRERGYAIAVDELEQGLTAVAAPIRNAHSDIIASMSVSGASFRLRGDVLDLAVKELLAAAADVSFRLGWNDPVT
ncbi:MAG: IclR family transcriptional regulator [Nocardioides sp.]|nr:IclR family transcriptional regulator [Nocardioides sp.]